MNTVEWSVSVLVVQPTIRQINMTDSIFILFHRTLRVTLSEAIGWNRWLAFYSFFFSRESATIATVMPKMPPNRSPVKICISRCLRMSIARHVKIKTGIAINRMRSTHLSWELWPFIFISINANVMGEPRRGWRVVWMYALKRQNCGRFLRRLQPLVRILLLFNY